MIDFEIAVINSINAVFPRAEIKGCFFHLCQNVYRKVQALGLQQLYQNDTNFAIQVRMIAALTFVPLDKVIEHFENLQEHFIDAVSPVLDYFEDTYIGRPLHHGRRPPIFAHNLWNMYARTDAQLPRTNNSVEGWHRSFQAGLSSYHPNFWTT